MEEKVLHPEESRVTGKSKDEVIWSSVLCKRGHFRKKKWLTRFFVLTPTHLRYYKKPCADTSSAALWKTDARYFRGEICLSDLIKVDLHDDYPFRPFIFVVTVVRTSIIPWRKCTKHEHWFQASSEEDRDRWMRYLKPTKNLMTTSYSLDVLQSMTSVTPPVSARDLYLYLLGHAVEDVDQSGKILQESFPVFTALIREIESARDAVTCVHVFDQLLGEVQDGLWNETLKRVLAFAAEITLENRPDLWTDSVKAAYAAIMKAMYRYPPLSRDALRKQPSCLGSSYTLGRRLGVGANSLVRVGWSNVLSKQVAIKCIAKAPLTANDHAALRREVDILRTLSHPNIVPLLEFIDEGDMYYIVTPLCTGGELLADVVQRTHYAEADARVVVLKLSSALAYVHAQGIVHRDIKPENVLLANSDPNADLVLCDFGFAKVVTREKNAATKIGTACGTPGYIAPEIVKGLAYGTSVDCWSLGVLLFILLVGQPPFPGQNHADILNRVVCGEYSMEAPGWAAVSAQAKEVVRGLLTVDPFKRWTAAQVLAHRWCSNDWNVMNGGEGNNLNNALVEMRQWRASSLTKSSCRFGSLSEEEGHNAVRQVDGEHDVNDDGSVCALEKELEAAIE